MKKLFAILVALCLMLSAAMAETAVEVNWNDYFGPAVEAAGVEGEFVTFDEIAVKIWLPSQLQAVELTDEDRQKGYIGYFTSEDGATLAFIYVNADGITREDYAALLQQSEDITDVEIAVVNGLPCVNYRMPAQDSVNVAFTTEAGNILEVIMSPASVENAEYVWGAVAASIMNAD